MPSKEDLSRAFFCSEAVYESSNGGAEIFLQNTQRHYPTIQFAKVHMSLDLFGQHKFLVAYAEDAIFIAFRGTTTLEDIATNLKLARDPRYGGAFHSGFFKRSDVFFKPDCNPILGLLSLQKRIIFCGWGCGTHGVIPSLCGEQLELRRCKSLFTRLVFNFQSDK
jgi:hypothetical protein